MTWLPFALAAGVASALNVAASKRLSARGRPAVVGGVVHLAGGLACLAVLPLVGGDLGPFLAQAPALLGMAVLHVAGNVWYFAALARTPLSEIDLFLRSSALWTVIAGAVALGERLSAGAAVGALLVLAALATVAERPRRLRFSAPQRLALAGAVAFGVGNVIDKAISGPFHPLGYTTWVLLLTGVGMLAVARPRRAELAALAPWRPTAATVAVTFALAQWALIEAYAAGGRAGDVVLVAQVRLVLLLAAGVLVFRERDRLARKGLAAALMIVGIAALARAGG